MFTILAVDWGEKRCGLAFGNPDTELVLTYTQECFTKDIFYTLDKEIIDRKIQTIVIGLPTNFQGGDTHITDKINQFVEQIKHDYPNLEITTVNERSSTKDAKKSLENNKNKHSLNHQAAAKILEYYFYQKKYKNSL
jgi:putative Holliday junction resolvase